MTPPFNTLAASDELEKSGIERKQARAVTRVISYSQQDFVTREDLDARLYRMLWL